MITYREMLEIAREDFEKFTYSEDPATQDVVSILGLAILELHERLDQVARNASYGACTHGRER